MIKDVLKELCALPGVSGTEDAVRAYIEERARKTAEEIVTDAMGNLLVFVRGERAPKEKVMLAAHMDEVGIIVTEITEEGYLRFDFVGGVDRRVVIGKRVLLGEKAVPGVIALKAVHLLEDGEGKKVPPTKSLYVDLGCRSREEAEQLVSLGDVGTFDDHIVEFGNGFLRAKAIDDRIGCSVMLTLIEERPPVDTWFAFTVQEEVGCRGAAVAASRIEPGFAAVLEGTTAADMAGVEKGKEICFLGKGVVIPFMDKGTIYDRETWEFAVNTAEKNGIPWQTKTTVAGGTDASALSTSATSGLSLTGEYSSVQMRNSPGTMFAVPMAVSTLLPRISSIHLRSSSSKNARIGSAAAPNISL